MKTQRMGMIGSLRINASHWALAEVRTFVENALTVYGIESSIVYDLVVAINEIATNIVVHGYRDQAGPLVIELHDEGDALLAMIRDEAPLFDPTQAPLPDLTIPLLLRPPGGLGIFMARQLTDEMRYAITAQGGNELTLVKRYHGG